MIFFAGLFGIMMIGGTGYVLWPIIKRHPILTVVSVIALMVMIRFLPSMISDMQDNLRDQLSQIAASKIG